MKLAPQPSRRNPHAKLAPPNLSVSAHRSRVKLGAVTPFRINTCESVSKQATLTPFRMNTYEKPRGGGRGPSLGGNRSTQDLLEVCDRDLRHFLRQVVCGSQI